MDHIKDYKEQLLEAYPYKIEMHAHTTPVSTCSRVTPEQMVQLYSAIGFDAVVITNHFLMEMFKNRTKEEAISYYINDFEKTRELGEKVGIKILLGAEVRFTENVNDYLLYGTNREQLLELADLLPYGIEHFRKTFDLSGSVFLQAHPFRDSMERVDPSLLDGIETYNMHPEHNARIAVAARYARENDFKIEIAGSDFHYPDQNHEGLAALRTKTLPSNSYELAKLLRSGDYVMEIGQHSIIIP